MQSLGAARVVLDKSSVESIILYSVLGIVSLMFIFMIICCCFGKFCRVNKDEEDVRSESVAGASILPPVFYTEGIEDPLLQPDLKDHVKQPTEQ